MRPPPSARAHPHPPVKFHFLVKRAALNSRVPTSSWSDRIVFQPNHHHDNSLPAPSPSAMSHNGSGVQAHAGRARVLKWGNQPVHPGYSVGRVGVFVCRAFVVRMLRRFKLGFNRTASERCIRGFLRCSRHVPAFCLSVFCLLLL